MKRSPRLNLSALFVVPAHDCPACRQRAIAMHRLGLVESFHALQTAGFSATAAAAAINQPMANVWRWHRAWLRGGFNALVPGISPGRPRKQR